MNNQTKIPAEKIPEIFEHAAREYAEKNQSYSVEEVIQAGVEARIPPEYIQRAIAQVQSQQNDKPPSRKLLSFNPAINTIGIIAAFILGSLLTATIAGIQPPQNRISSQVSFLEADLERANLKEVDLRGRDLSYTNFTKAKLEKADLSGSNLRNANLSRANLKNANLSGTDLRNANLSRANLKNANLVGANLDGANLSRAKLEGAIMPTGMRY
ncbi:pentapeptide repeat-containing protein [Gloeocapsopsis dulcis]|uniref:Low-complexity protein n=1 Tax=Gloeocapsopsis dulcis AAB1 = 1H9 TaxID=1433147 RepID=A0A6N8FZ22_9CHRO|nr:pentapeptide repeat-containing protein [Gloeocapsopsis dulcis]MUL38400.1 hypothetical protein [Gloeocapsopsis dulcis AAB1 = 1H9]WNN89186.1 pentapeptide repeat-containing protein [Gloeocapsopsis dulcis]